MAKKNGKKKTKKSIAELLPDGFEEAAMSMSDNELKEKICEAARLKIEHKKQMKEDPDLLQITEQLKHTKEPYMNDIKACDAKMEYCALLLDERGAVCK